MMATEDGIFWNDEKILKMIMVMVVPFCKYNRSHWIVYFKSVSYMACELYLNIAV